jgi:hypothetical protein
MDGYLLAQPCFLEDFVVQLIDQSSVYIVK